MNIRVLAPLSMALMLAGCASSDTVVVLPPSDGHSIGGVVMQAHGKTVVLDKAYASASPGDSQAGTSKPEEINTAFADVLSARPIPPSTYKPLLFKSDSETELSGDSEQYLVETVLKEIKDRRDKGQAVEVVVTGHTDTVGALDYNDNLSRARAKAIAEQIISLGIPRDVVVVEGRGERDAKSPDETRDAGERRVDVTAR